MSKNTQSLILGLCLITACICSGKGKGKVQPEVQKLNLPQNLRDHNFTPCDDDQYCSGLREYCHSFVENGAFQNLKVVKFYNLCVTEGKVGEIIAKFRKNRVLDKNIKNVNGYEQIATRDVCTKGKFPVHTASLGLCLGKYYFPTCSSDQTCSLNGKNSAELKCKKVIYSPQNSNSKSNLSGIDSKSLNICIGALNKKQEDEFKKISVKTSELTNINRKQTFQQKGSSLDQFQNGKSSDEKQKSYGRSKFGINTNSQTKEEELLDLKEPENNSQTEKNRKPSVKSQSDLLHTSNKASNQELGVSPQDHTNTSPNTLNQKEAENAQEKPATQNDLNASQTFGHKKYSGASSENFGNQEEIFNPNESKKSASELQSQQEFGYGLNESIKPISSSSHYDNYLGQSFSEMSSRKDINPFSASDSNLSQKSLKSSPKSSQNIQENASKVSLGSENNLQENDPRQFSQESLQNVDNGQSNVSVENLDEVEKDSEEFGENQGGGQSRVEVEEDEEEEDDLDANPSQKRLSSQNLSQEELNENQSEQLDQLLI